jgi:hypothetical protein
MHCSHYSPAACHCTPSRHGRTNLVPASGSKGLGGRRPRPMTSPRGPYDAPPGARPASGSARVQRGHDAVDKPRHSVDVVAAHQL